MRRRLFSLAAGVSAVLGVAAAVLWVKSYFAADYLVGGAFPSQDGAWRLVSARWVRGWVRAPSARRLGRSPSAPTGVLPPSGVVSAALAVGAAGIRPRGPSHRQFPLN